MDDNTKNNINNNNINLGIEAEIHNEGSNFNLLNSKKEDNNMNNKNDDNMNINNNIKEVNFVNISTLNNKKTILDNNKPKIEEVIGSQNSDEYDDFEKK